MMTLHASNATGKPTPAALVLNCDGLGQKLVGKWRMKMLLKAKMVVYAKAVLYVGLTVVCCKYFINLIVMRNSSLSLAYAFRVAYHDAVQLEHVCRMYRSNQPQAEAGSVRGVSVPGPTRSMHVPVDLVKSFIDSWAGQANVPMAALRRALASVEDLARSLRHGTSHQDASESGSGAFTGMCQGSSASGMVRIQDERSSFKFKFVNEFKLFQLEGDSESFVPL
jgi:hypothetical protein